MKEKWITVRIGGYPRRCKESQIEKIKADAEKMKAQYIRLGVPKEEVEMMYKIEIVKEEE